MSALKSEYRGFRLETRASFDGGRYSDSLLIESMELVGRRLEQSVGSFSQEAIAHCTAQLEAMPDVDGMKVAEGIRAMRLAHEPVLVAAGCKGKDRVIFASAPSFDTGKQRWRFCGFFAISMG